MTYSRSTLHILYGSQTGTAQDMAETLAREATKRYFTVSLSSLDAYNVRNLPNESFFIILVSTTGDGEVPDNGKKFWKFLLQKNLSSSSLTKTSCALFGLGDSSYTKFNAAVRKMTTRLQQLGSRLVYERGIGDEQSTNGIYSDFDVWCKGLWEYIDKQALFPLPMDVSIRTDAQLVKPRYHTHPLPLSLLNNSDTTVTTNDASTLRSKLRQTEESRNYSLSQIFQVVTNTFGLTVPNLIVPSPLTLTNAETLTFASLLSRYDTLAKEEKSSLQNYIVTLLQHDQNDSETVQPYVYSTIVKENIRLTNPDWNQDVRHITLAFVPSVSSSPSNTSSTLAPPTSNVTVSSSSVSTSSPSSIASISSTAMAPPPVPNPYYRTGDIAIVFPRNPKDQVDRFIQRLGLTNDTVICINSIDYEKGNTVNDEGKGIDSLPSFFTNLCISSSSSTISDNDVFATNPTTEMTNGERYNLSSSSAMHQPILNPLPKSVYLPKLITIDHLFTYYLDICSIPKRGILEQIAFFATKEEEKNKLFEMTSVQGSDIYHKYCQQEKRTFVELWDDFLSLRTPLNYILDWIPLLQPRYFSIASSPYDSNGGVDLCVGIVKYTTKYGRKKYGICSNYLQGLRTNDKLTIMIKGDGLLSLSIQSLLSSVEHRSDSSLPFLPPIIGIGPGTGIAPLRSLWRTLCHLSNDKDTTDGSIALTPRKYSFYMYFGCRSQTKDWLYATESSQLAYNDSLHIHSKDLQPTKGATTKDDRTTTGEDGRVTVSGSMGVPSNSLTFSATSVPHFQYSYRVAFSRDPVPVLTDGNSSSSNPPTIPVPSKVYVQYYLAVDSSNLYKLIIEQNAYIYIAGSAQKMPTDVVNTIKAILKKYGKSFFLPTDDPEINAWDLDKTSKEYTDKLANILVQRIDRYISTMERTKRLVIEAWS